MNSTTVDVRKLTRDQRARMFELLDQHFVGVTPEQFEHDLLEKTVAILLYDTTGTMRGFTTMLAYTSASMDDHVGVITSGDTIVEHGYWSSLELPRAGLHALQQLRDSLRCSKTYWLLIVSGVRTYRFLPTIWKRFVPSARCEDAALIETRNALALERFSSRFDSSTGIVRFPHPQRLREHLLVSEPADPADADASFFLSRNPGHAEGDELVCLCDASDSNLSRAGMRLSSRHRVSP